MALISLMCVACGHKQEELLTDRDYPACEKCGGELRRSWSGKCYGFAGKGDGKCGGNCATCKGCGK